MNETEFVDSIRKFLAKYGIEARSHHSAGVDVSIRPQVGERNHQATRVAGVLRRYGADYWTILDYLAIANGYGPVLPPAENPLPFEELERIAKSIAERPPKFPDMLRSDWQP
jgi:hypothetical protein